MRTLALLAAACIGTTAPTLHAADLKKVLRTPVQSAEKGFDCAWESDEMTGTLCDHIFDSLLQYDHLARPIRLQPRAAAAMPEISADGRTYTIRVKPGIVFTDDPAFKGARRELVAADYAYSIKRLMDPQLKAQWQFLVEGKIVGLDELRDEAKARGRFDYDKPIRGLETPERHTLVIRLKQPDYNMNYILAMPATAAVAREVVEFYGAAFAEHPVGTGPYRLKDWRRASRIVLEASPSFRGETFETAARTEDLDARGRELVAYLKGKRLPLIGRIEVYPVEEEQPRWLAFLNNEYDYIRPVPTPFITTARPGGKLAPNLAARGMWAMPDEVAWITYTTFNMADTIDGKPNAVGGYTPERIALRRALSMAYPIDDEISIIEKNEAVRAWSVIAEGMAGYTPERTPTLDYNPAKAKALLDLYGYVDRDGDGWREQPDGSPLVVDHASTPDQRAKSRNELWKRAMDAIGVRMSFNKVEKMPELRKQAQLGRVQMMSYGWIADYPDGENFLQLFWSKSIGGANYSYFSMPEFDRQYEMVKTMPDSAERTALYRRMVHLLWVYNPWRVNTLKRGTILMQPWVIGFQKHPFAHDPWRYMDILPDKLPAELRR
ncbi:MAG TPA: ABC transporter substrate-binding protein [Usitatibacteraceae bacterium]|nr:ABC transporter substrate-binding protein [Usitatibacteraceae bacterium]